jgi:hypothetical protein
MVHIQSLFLISNLTQNEIVFFTQQKMVNWTVNGDRCFGRMSGVMSKTFLNGYQDLAHGLAIYAPNAAFHYLFPTLLVETVSLYNASLGEDNDAQMRTKVGDVLWCCAEIFTALDSRLGDYENFASQRVPTATFRTYLWAIVSTSREACRQWTKIVRDKNGLVEPFDKPKLLLPTSDVVRYLDLIAPPLNTNVREIAEANLARLAERKRTGKLATEETRM